MNNGWGSGVKGVFDALQVIRLTPAIRAFLKKNDPMALQQADAASFALAAQMKGLGSINKYGKRKISALRNTEFVMQSDRPNGSRVLLERASVGLGNRHYVSVYWPDGSLYLRRTHNSRSKAETTFYKHSLNFDSYIRTFNLERKKNEDAGLA